MTFIHPFYSIIESYWPMYIWWNYFQWDCVTDRYHHHLSSMMAITQGTQLFLLVEMFGSDRWNGQGNLYFGVDIVLVKHHVKGLSNHTVSTYFPDGYTNPIRLFQSRFVHHDLLGGFRLWLLSCTPCAIDLGYQKNGKSGKKRVTTLMRNR